MSTPPSKIHSPADPALNELCERLRQAADELDQTEKWPAEQLRWCAEFGVFEWFASRDNGGQQWNDEEIVRGYLALSAACLTTTFIITQRTGACQRIERSDNAWVKERLLPGLIDGRIFATVGISHLTTSRRHLAKPVLRATETSTGFELDGFSPWVTGASAADVVVLGATLEDDRQILAAVPTDLPGIEVPKPAKLLGLAASHTGPVNLNRVQLPKEWLLAGPVHDVMKQGVGARTGGLQTSTLAVGLAQCSIEFLETEAKQRPDLVAIAQALRNDWSEARESLLRAAAGDAICSDSELRTRANSLVLRASQSALAAAKGTGYVAGHPVGRWCREALFFLVWSCPQPVLAANLCEFAGIQYE